jgi:WD40 repeat protein
MKTVRALLVPALLVLVTLAVGGGAGAPEVPLPPCDQHGDPLPPDALARLGTIRFRSADFSHRFVFSRNGTSVIVLGIENPVRIFDLGTGQVRGTLGEGRDYRSALALSPDGSQVAVATEIGKKWFLHIWDLATGELVQSWPASESAIYGLVFGPDGKWIASAGWDQTIHLWEVASGKGLPFGQIPTTKKLQLGEFPPTYEALALSRDGKILAAGTADRVIEGWDVATGECLWRSDPHYYPWASLAYSAAEDCFVVSGDNAVHLLDRRSGRDVRQMPNLRDAGSSLDVSPDGRTLATTVEGRGTILCRDLRSGRVLFQVEGARLHGHFLKFSPDGKRLGAVSRRGTVRIWEVPSGREWDPWPGHHGAVVSMSVSPSGEVVATGGDTTVRLWDPRSGRLLDTLPTGAGLVAGLAYSPDGKLLAAGTDKGEVRVWETKSCRQVLSLEVTSERETVVAFSPDGKLLASGDRDHEVRLFDIATGEETRRWRVSEKRSASQILWSDRGQLLALFELAVVPLSMEGDPSEELYALDGAHWVAFTPDIQGITTLEWKHVCIRSAASGKMMRAFPEEVEAKITCAALSPDGWLVATGEFNGTVRVWERATGKELLVRRGHRAAVRSLAFSPDGQLVISGSNDTTSLVWSLQSKPAAAPRPGDLERWWASLGGDDAAEAFQCQGRLESAGKEAVAFLREKLTPGVRPPGTLRKLMRELENERFRDRQEAYGELLESRTLTLAALQERIRITPKEDARKMLEVILDRLEEKVLSNEEVRWFRALRVLESQNDPESRRLLETLAKGDQDDLRFLTATKALQRLRQRTNPNP